MESDSDNTDLNTGDSNSLNEPADTDSASAETSGPGTESDESEDPGYLVGEFHVEVESLRDGAPWLRVTHGDNFEKPLLQSVPGQGFVSASAGEPQIKENRGSFLVDEGLLRLCTEQTLESVTFTDGELILVGALGGEGCASRYTMTFSSPLPRHLRFEIALEDESLENRVSLRFSTHASERFFGFGESFTVLDHKGRRFPVLSQEQGIGRGKQPLSSLLNIFSKGSAGDWYTTYAAAPYTLTSDRRALFLENSEISIFDLTAADLAEVSVLGSVLVGRVLAGDTPIDLIEAYTEYAGRMPPLPDWINEGAVVGTQGGTFKVLGELWELSRHDCPIAAFWLQDWVGRRETSFGSQLWWNWGLNELWYPGWDELVAMLEQMDIRVLTYVNPFLVDVAPDLGFQRNLFQEARSKGFLVRNEKGRPYLVKNTDFDAGMLDLSNDAARQWFKEVLRDDVLGAGSSGYMADFAEALPFDAVLSSGEDPAVFHNLYPERWAALHRELFEEEGLVGDAVAFHRSGFTRSPAFATLFWEGDQLHSWDENDGLASAIIALISSGLSGYALNHSDIGGYTTVAQWYADIIDPFQIFGVKTVRSQELFERWAEANAFTAVYRTHEGLIPEENVQYYSNEETYRHFTRFAKVYRALAPYRRALMDEAQARGTPLVRHPWLHFEDDPEILKLTRQFMLGSEVMVAPVLEEGADTVTIYLPKGRWVHLFRGEVIDVSDQGSWEEIDAPIGEPAVFFKEGSTALEAVRTSLLAQGVL